VARRALSGSQGTPCWLLGRWASRIAKSPRCCQAEGAGMLLSEFPRAEPRRNCRPWCVWSNHRSRGDFLSPLRLPVYKVPATGGWERKIAVESFHFSISFDNEPAATRRISPSPSPPSPIFDLHGLSVLKRLQPSQRTKVSKVSCGVLVLWRPSCSPARCISLFGFPPPLL